MEVQVVIREAEELRVVQSVGKQDPYVILKYKDFQHQTGTIDDGDRKCQWNDEVVLTIDENEEIEIIVKDENVFVDALIGSARIQTNRIFDNAGFLDDWFTILSPVSAFNSNLRPSGRIRLVFRSTSFQSQVNKEEIISEIKTNIASEEEIDNRKALKSLLAFLLDRESLVAVINERILGSVLTLIEGDRQQNLCSHVLWKVSLEVRESDILDYNRMLSAFEKLLTQDSSIQIVTLKGLSNYISINFFRRLLTPQFVEKTFIPFMQSDQPEVIQAAINCLYQISCFNSELLSASVLDPVVSLVKEENDAVTVSCLNLFANVSLSSKADIVVCKILPKLPEFLHSETFDIQLAGHRCLYNICFLAAALPAMRDDYFYSAISRSLNSSDQTIVYWATSICFKLSTDDSFASALCTDSIVSSMVDRFSFGDNATSHNIVGFLRNLALKKENVPVLKRAGVVDVLRPFADSDTNKKMQERAKKAVSILEA